MSIIEAALNKTRGAERPRTSDSSMTSRATETAASGSGAAEPAFVRPPLQIDPRGHALGDVRLVLGAQQYLNEFRSLKRSLLQRMLSTPAVAERAMPNLVLVTSALPGDGKTSVSTNLALAASLDRDYEVLLIDTDVAKRHLSELFGADKETGLTDVLRDRNADVRNFIFPTSIPRLSFLAAGSSLKGAPELFASTRTGAVLAELTRWRPRVLVIMDSAPLLLTSEPAILSSWAGQVLLVVRASTTLKDSVSEAIAQLEHREHATLVLNDWRPIGLAERDRHGRYQGYYNDTE